MFSPYLVDILLSLPMIAAGLIGLACFGKVARDGAWRCMLIGLILLSLTALVWPLWRMLEEGPPNFQLRVYLGQVFGWTSAIGGILFAAGFAMCGYKASRATDRVKELEAIIEAQSEKLSRLNS